MFQTTDQNQLKQNANTQLTKVPADPTSLGDCHGAEVMVEALKTPRCADQLHLCIYIYIHVYVYIMHKDICVCVLVT